MTDPATVRRPGSGPDHRTRPPPAPAPGPTSTTQSHRCTTAMSCSTTSTVLPADTSSRSRARSRSVSWGCSPAEGSSRTYTTPNSPDRSAVASRSRWSSPELTVDTGRPRARWPRPRSAMRPSRPTRSSRSTRSASVDAVPPSPGSCPSRDRISARRSETAVAEASSTARPAQVTARASGRSRRPPQTSHGRVSTDRRARCRWVADRVSARVRST
ncbi:hypothetical protein ACFPT5_22270 [Ornithinimicrobium kibberense]